MTADEFTKLLDELQQRLQGPSAHVFELAVRQVVIQSVVVLVLFAAVTVAVAVIGPRVYRWAQEGDSYSDRGLIVVLGGTGAAFVWGVLGYLAVVGLIALLNPEYAALRDILGSLKP